MKGSDNRELAWVQHGFRQESAHRVRDGIVAVQKVQILRLRYLGHLCRQGQRIGRMVEEGIGGDFHLVKMDARARFYKTHRRGIADEMNLVSALRQFLPQLGGYYAASTVRGIASNSYFHAPPIPEARLDDLALFAHAQVSVEPPARMLDDLAAFQQTLFSSPGVKLLANAILSGSTPFPDPDPELNELEQHGKVVFNRACAQCHGSSLHPSGSTAEFAFVRPLV